MKRLVILLLLLLSQQSFSLTTITSDTTFSGNIVLTDSIRVEEGALLTVAAGTVIKADSAVHLYVRGRMLSLGTAEDSVYFTSLDTAKKWCGITLSSEEEYDSTIFEYTVIENAHKGSWGGGLYIVNLDPIRLSHCVIRNNSMTAGGTTSQRGGAGLAVHSTEIILYKCKIINNQATQVAHGSGIYSRFSQVIIDSCLISGNTTTSDYAYGVGYYSEQCNIKITNSAIENNISYATKMTYGVGAHFYNTKIDIINTSISKNSVGKEYSYSNDIESDAMGIAIYARYSSPLIENCIIDENYNYSSKSYSYDTSVFTTGIIYIESAGTYYVERAKAIISNTSISNNKLYSYGVSAIYTTENDAIIESCTIKNNESEYHKDYPVTSVAIKPNDCHPSISFNTEISSNLPLNGYLSKYIILENDTTLSGEIKHNGFTVDSNITLTIEEGSTLKGYNGARIYSFGTIMAVGTEKDSIVFKSENDEEPWAGMIFYQRYLDVDNSTTFKYCMFEGAEKTHISNYAGGSYYTWSYPGGAMQFGYTSNVLIDKCLFINNESNSSGGALYSYLSDITIKNSNFINNVSHAYGGAISGADSVVNCNIIGNKTMNGGGGAGLRYVDVIKDCNISFNRSYIDSGSVGTPGVSAAKFIENSVITDNDAICALSGTASSSIGLKSGGKIVNSTITRNRCYVAGVEVPSYSLYAYKSSTQLEKFDFEINNSLVEDISLNVLNRGEIDFIINNSTINGSVDYKFDDGGEAIVDIRANSSIISGGLKKSEGNGVYRSALNYCNIKDLVNPQNAVGNMDVTSQFIDTLHNDFRLKPSSPCINSGGSSTEPYHLLGNDRVVATVDLGAYEYTGNYKPILLNDSEESYRVDVQKIYLEAFDYEGDDVTYSIVEQPIHYTATIEADSLVITPKAYVPLGSDYVEIKATDSKGASTTKHVVFNIVNLAPIGYTKIVGTQDTITVSLPVIDKDGYIGKYKTTEMPKFGSSSSYGYGEEGKSCKFKYYPYRAFETSGIDSVTIYVEDNDGAGDTCKIFYVWDTSNRTPVVNDITASTSKNSSVKIELQGTDFEDKILEYSINDSCTNGELIVRGDSLLYTPSIDFIGMDTIIYEAIDDSGAISNSAMIIIEVDSETSVKSIVETADDILLIYPNPAQKMIYLQTEEIGELTLIDVTGKTVCHINNKQANITDLATGIYYVVMKHSGKTKTIKSFYKK